jgi:hypothetical protein
MWFDDQQRLYFNMKPDEWKEAKSCLKNLCHNSAHYPEINDIVEVIQIEIKTT